MTKEAAEPRRAPTPADEPVSTPTDEPAPPAPSGTAPASPRSLPDDPPAPANDDDRHPEEPPTADVPLPPVPGAPPVDDPAGAAGAESGPGPASRGGPPPGANPPPATGYGTPPGANPPPAAAGPPPADAGFASRYGLVRPRQGRYLAGVCAAIGRATNTDPVLWRVLLAVLGVFGGIGILVYVVAWLVIPAEGDSASPVEAMLGRGRSSTSPITVVILGVLVAVMLGFIVSDRFRAVLLGAAVLVGGVMLLKRSGSGANPAAGSPETAAGPPPGGPFSGAPVTASTTVDGDWPGDPTTRPGAPTASEPAFSAPVPGATPGYPVPAARPAEPDAAAPWPAPEPVTAIPALSSAPPAPYGAPPPGGYRPPFAPHGPYAPARAYPPAPPAPPAPKPPKERSPLGAATFSMIFLALGAVAALDLSGAVPVGPSAYFAATLITIALGLLVGAWFGRARWLIALGLAATLALGVSALAESFRDVAIDGPTVWRPSSYELVADRYATRFGDGTLDLSGVDFTGRDATVTVQVDLGRLRVILPPDVDVTVLADVNAGDATVLGERWSGLQGPMREVRDLGGDGAGGGTLRLYLHVNAGDMEVTR